jgi:uncharacterized protein YbbC (DUF1343 family)
MPVRLGNERLFDEALPIVEGKRVGLLTNPSGVNSRLERTADRLHRTKSLELTALFGPEHGLRSNAEDGVAVASSIDPATGVPVHSLYGEKRQPDEATLRDVDVLLCDIQDVGVRFYTFLSTLFETMKACAEFDIPVVVLDRPNPIGGELVEGNILDPAFCSFVGVYPLPVRHGMTLGELAFFLNEEGELGAEVSVVEMRGWDRANYWADTGLIWVPPSPNMPTADTTLVYPGMCFFEGTNLSEGRGTTRPFEQVGAPFVDGNRLAEELNREPTPGNLFRPVSFVPASGKFADQTCGGIHLHVIDREIFRPVTAGLTTLVTAARLWPESFAWRLPGHGIHNFDKLAGTDRIRFAIDSGANLETLMSQWDQERETFKVSRQRHLLY